MDTLSHLITLSQLQVELDTRCLLAAPFAIDHQPLVSGEAAFHFLLDGECRLHNPNIGEYHLQRGDFVLLPHGSEHGLVGMPVWTDGPLRPFCLQPANQQTMHALPIKTNIDGVIPADVDMLCGRFRFAAGAGTLLMQAMPAVIQIHLHTVADVTPVTALVTLLRGEAGTRQPGAHSLVNALGQVLLIYALRAYCQHHPQLSGLLAAAADSRLGHSLQAMLSHPGAPWTLASLGAQAAMSRATYARHFHAKAGMSASACLRHIRIMHACAQLISTSHDQATIAEAVGYDSEAAFGKAFRQVMGMTPGRWRRAQRTRELA